MSGEFHDRMRTMVEPLLTTDEVLEGVVAGTHRKTFSGRTVAIVVTSRRLLVQPLTRRLDLDGAPTVIEPEELAKASAVVAGSEWWNTEYPVTDAAFTVRLRTADGTKLTLDLMRGGDGLLGRLGGGAAQEAGVAALAAWMRRAGDASS
jgi:hypothetical protein